MPIINPYEYHIYIVTNPARAVLYTGVTNDLRRRITEHWLNRGKEETFAGKYYCYNLIYYEFFKYINDAIGREKQIKGWRRQKKIDLINTMNPTWTFFNAIICDGWPPGEIQSNLD